MGTKIIPISKVIWFWLHHLKGELPGVFWSAITRNNTTYKDAYYNSPWGQIRRRYVISKAFEYHNLSFSDWLSEHYWDEQI
jgi:hypothetical protein